MIADLRWRDLRPGRLHLLVLRGFVGPFAVSFLVIQFIQVLLVLGQQKQHIFGKGFGLDVVIELVSYLAAWPTLESTALAVLMGSLITLGDMGERYELAAIKSSGISLIRLLVPLFLIVVMVSTLALGFAFYARPWVNLQFWSRMYDVKQSQPAFALKPGLFATIADGYAMRITDRRADGMLYDVLIYDHTEERGNVSVTMADSGRMQMDERTLFLKLQLYSGEQYDEPKPDAESPQSMPFTRVRFDTLNTKLDLSGLQLKSTDRNRFRSHQYMLNIHELGAKLDTLNRRPLTSLGELKTYIDNYSNLGSLPQKQRWLDSLRTARDSVALTPYAAADTLASLPYYDQNTIISSANSTARGLENYLSFAIARHQNELRDIWGYAYERHMRFVLPVACLMFLFVGAPLGAIIRKGGIGLPMVIGIALFVLFYLLMTFGKKMAQEGVAPVWFGAWMPVGVIFLLAVYLSYQSATDSRLFDLSVWRKLLAQGWDALRSRLGRRHPVAQGPVA